MKEICKDYFENIKSLIKNKSYIYSIIIVTILSYGFAITNFSIGVDDVCFDRYVTGTYLLSAGRWGTTLLYTLLQLFSFTPFWLEFVVTILTVMMGMVFTAFIRRQFEDKMNIIHCILVTSILISYPILHQAFIYQSTNLSVVVCNFALMVLPIIIFEKVKKNKSLKEYIVITIILPLFISMYESCCQTFILITCIIAFIQIYNKKNNKELIKMVIKYLFISTVILLVGIIINAYINLIIKIILRLNGILTLDYSTKAINLFNNSIANIINMLRYNIFGKLCNDFVNFGFFKEFIILATLVVCITVVKSIKEKKYLLIPLILIIVFSNFAINLLQLGILYRVNTSWCFTMAFFTEILLISVKNKNIHRVICIVFAIIILLQTKEMNQYFYNDYKRYQRESNYASYIANQIVTKCNDMKKPIVYIPKNNDGIHQNRINVDNGWSLIDWSLQGAFSEKGAELTKFINSLGYNFTIATNQQVEEELKDYQSHISINNQEIVYETENYILVFVEYNI